MTLNANQFYTAYQLSESGLPLRYEFECVRPEIQTQNIFGDSPAYGGIILRTAYNQGRNPSPANIPDTLIYHATSTLIVAGRDHPTLSNEEGDRFIFLGCFLFNATFEVICELLDQNLNETFLQYGKFFVVNPEEAERRSRIAKQVHASNDPIPDFAAGILGDFSDDELDNYGRIKGTPLPEFRDWWKKEVVAQ